MRTFYLCRVPFDGLEGTPVLQSLLTILPAEKWICLDENILDQSWASVSA